jgi:hypothetical protein
MIDKRNVHMIDTEMFEIGECLMSKLSQGFFGWISKNKKSNLSEYGEIDINRTIHNQTMNIRKIILIIGMI